MINELIEKEMEKLRLEGSERYWDWDGRPEELEIIFYDSLQTIAKEVAMRFKKDVNLTQDYYDIGYGDRNEEVNNLADQIINEVSK